jgi:hypothetical protein
MYGNKQRVIFGVVVLAALAIVFVAGRQTAPRALGGEFDDVALVQCKSTVHDLELVCKNPQECKWVAALEANEDCIQVGDGPAVLSLPIAGDPLYIDLPDSRVNLLVENSTKSCDAPDGQFQVCEYDLVEGRNSLTVLYKEVIGSSGLPEYVGTPR